MIAIIDYGVGNLGSVTKALKNHDIEAQITSDKDVIGKADGVILPGVGAFGDAIKSLHEYGLFQPIKDYIATGKPFLGICLGLHLLFEGSEESPGVEGLSVFKGKCIRFTHDMIIPHVGWNTIIRKNESPILKGVGDNYFYFVHSYHAQASEDIVAATCDYGYEFPAVVSQGNVFATQFHPEKSQEFGIKIIQNFGELV